jgi:hypothetical protein
MTHRPDDGGGKHLWNVCLLLRDYMSLCTRKLPSSYSPSWKHEILHWFGFLILQPKAYYKTMAPVSISATLQCVPRNFDGCFALWVTHFMLLQRYAVLVGFMLSGTSRSYLNVAYVYQWHPYILPMNKCRCKVCLFFEFFWEGIFSDTSRNDLFL